MNENKRTEELQEMYLEIGLGDPGFAERFLTFGALPEEPTGVAYQIVIAGAADTCEERNGVHG